MDQTTINQFFVTRKSSFSSSLPPAKRVKLDVTKIEKKDSKSRGVRVKTIGKLKSKNANASKVATRKSSKHKGDGNFFGLNDLKPIEVTNKSVVDQRITCEGKTAEMTRSNGIKSYDEAFTAVKSNKSESISSSMHKGQSNKKGYVTPVKSMPKCSKNIHVGENIRKCTQLPCNDEINDQAKTILFSRGSTILKAGFENNLIKSPSKASEILNCLSPQKNYLTSSLTIIGSPSEVQLKSPTKLSEILNTLTPLKNTLTPQNELKNIDTIQSRLQSPQQKIDNSNMLKPPNELKNIQATVSISARRERLRNKFKHLLKDGAESSYSEADVTDLAETMNVCVSQRQEEKPIKEKAHEKFKNLAQKVVPSGFVLPQKFKILVEMFRCVDSILFLLNQRSEVCTFEKLKKSVQSMCSRNFKLNHFAAMKTVYPNAFTFRQEKGLCSAQGPSKSYQLTIEANFKDALTSNSSKITSTILITRRLQFEKNLLDIVKGHHQNFLRTLNMKICDSQIHRWHPHFEVNDIPDLELSNLPQPPIIKGFTSAADLIMNNRGNILPKVQNALCNVAKKTSQMEGAVDTNVVSNDTSRSVNVSEKKINTNSKLKGVSSSILERIRQKEQSKMQLAMTRDPVKEEKLSKMQRLPEICRILKSYFTAERKVAITLEDCVQKLSESYGTSIHLGKLEEHVRLISELVPEWLTIAMVRKFPFVKLAKGYDINKVINALNTLRTKESET